MDEPPTGRILTPAEALALTTTVNCFDFDCPACGTKSEVTLTDLSAEVRFCPICGLDRDRVEASIHG